MSEKEMVEPGTTQNDEWLQAWENGDIGFHREDIHPMLKNNLSRLVDGGSKVRILVPLCGKTVDMKWLSSLGHSVVGVDIALKGLEDFFKENNMKYTQESLEGLEGTVLISEDGLVKLYCCDFFSVTSDTLGGQFDGIWDRGGLVAINRSDRPRYVKTLKRLMTESGKYLVSAVEYDRSKYGGPPHCLCRKDLEEMFTENDGYCVELLEENPTLVEEFKQMGLDWFCEKLYIITQKK